MQMDLNDIRTFVCVAHAGTFSAAAKELGLPTSTISRSITRLEESIGTMLCQRSPKGLTLTDAGAAYLTTCKRALRSLRDGGDLLERHRQNPGGLIRIACPITMARDLLAPLLSRFVEAYPSLRIEIEAYSSACDKEPFEEVDIFFKVMAPKSSERRARRFPGTARALFASAKYLKEHGTPSDPAHLAQHRCIGSEVWKLAKGNKVVTPEINFHIVATDPGLNMQLACTDVGIANLPLWMASQLHANSTLVPVLPLWKPVPLSIFALYTGSNDLTPKVRAFLDFLAKYFGTDEDPRLMGHKPKDFFTDLHLRATPGA